jgi:hypothetical protein
LQKYETCPQLLLRQEVTMGEVADSHQVDRSTIARIQEVAKQGALAALAQSRPGTGRRLGTPSCRRPGPRSPG